MHNLDVCSYQHRGWTVCSCHWLACGIMTKHFVTHENDAVCNTDDLHLIVGINVLTRQASFYQ